MLVDSLTGERREVDDEEIGSHLSLALPDWPGTFATAVMVACLVAACTSRQIA